MDMETVAHATNKLTKVVWEDKDVMAFQLHQVPIGAVWKRSKSPDKETGIGFIAHYRLCAKTRQARTLVSMEAGDCVKPA